MKAMPVIRIDTNWVACLKKDATHLVMHFPFEDKILKERILPIQIKGSRKDTNYWSWNGDIDKPTLKPSIKTKYNNIICHSFVNDGIIEFLNDCTHEMKDRKLPLLEIK